jgi:hypothetical protein
MNSIDWVELIARQDIEALWDGIYQLVSRHRAAQLANLATDDGTFFSKEEADAELSQELFLKIYTEHIFERYSKDLCTSADIEFEIANIELPRLIGARMGMRYIPEPFDGSLFH